MCLRVFVRAAEGALVAMQSPMLSVRRCDADPVDARPDPNWAWELGAHSGCGCGFNVSSQEAWELGPEAASVPNELELALTDEERAEIDGNRASRRALAALLEEASRHGPVELFATWLDVEPPSRVETLDAKTIRETWEPLAEEVAYRFVPTPEPA